MNEDTDPILAEAIVPILDETTLSYSLAVKEDPKDDIKVVIGDDKDTSQFYPQVKISRWNNEVNSSIRLQLPGVENEVISQDVEKIVLDKGIYSVKLYDKPDASEEGGFEFEIHLSDIPKDNTFTFSVNTKELDWFYQPPLTQEEIDQGSVRPDNVVGSYAVYHKTKGGMNDISGMDYKVGKAFHVYRPHATDAKGEMIWGDLKLDESGGLLTIVIDQNWLDKATYPVVIDPTFGYTTIGGTSAAPSINDWERMRVGNPGVLGRVTGVSFYAKYGTTARNFRGGIFNSIPSVMTPSGSEVLINNSTGAWFESVFNIGPQLSNDNYYAVVIIDEDGAATNIYHFYDTGGTSGDTKSKTLGITYPTLDATGLSNTTNIASIYATYSLPRSLGFITNSLRPRIFRAGLAR